MARDPSNDSAALARERRLAAVVAAALLLGTLALYAPVAGFGFVRYDDHDYVASYPRISTGLSWANAAWALTAFHVGNWHPLTLIAHMADVSLFGLAPGAHHAVNAGLHALNAVLVFLLLWRPTRRVAPAALAAALFAAHPLQVESVAWISQLKSVLSLALLLLSLLAYEAFARRGGWGRYLGSLALCLGALSAKPTAVVAPALLVVLDVWPLGRATVRRLVEKIPFVAAAAAAALVTVIAQEHEGALGTLQSHPWPVRLADAVFAYAWYPARIFWPRDLSLFYPTDLGPAALAKVASAAALLLAVLGAAILLARRGPYVGAGAAWYGIALLPACGLVPFGTQIVADRYAYLPSIGLFAALAWAVSDGTATRSPWVRRAAAILCGATVLALALATRAQLGVWRDSETLLSRGVERAPDNVHARINYGLWLAEEGRLGEALPHLERAVAIAPRFATARLDLGFALARAGRLEEAREQYEAAWRLEPRNATLAAELGRVLARLGLRDEAEAKLRESIRLDPRLEAGHLLLGTVLYDEGRFEEAEAHLETAAALAPGDPLAKAALGANLAALGRVAEAVRVLREAAVPGPSGDRARLELGKLLGSAAAAAPPGRP
ncbi:MAG: tetratricopeptide repeat protein [Acidobacteriia bacterium]|nr:tetratricopeptide repeat protein [Terriglobia bacterium]